MISEQEAREAAVLQEEHSKRFFEGKMMGMEAHQEWGNAATTLIEFAKQELARRDAERAERALPITAEWLESIGFHNGGEWLYMAYHGGKVYVGSDKLYVYVNASPIYAITTRGQLLDLLAALKGGAT